MAEADQISYYQGDEPFVNQGPNLLGSYFYNDIRGGPERAVGLYEGIPVRITDKDTNELIYQGSNPDEIRAAMDYVTREGNDRHWTVETKQGAVNPVTGAANPDAWVTTTENKPPPPSPLGILADIALPLAMNFLIPGSGLLHGALTAAGGSILSGVAQGKPIGDIAKGALISGAGGALGGSLGGGASLTDKISSTLAKNVAQLGGQGAGGALGSALGSVAGSAVGNVADDALSVIASRLAPKVAGNVIGGVAGATAGGALNAALTPRGTSQYQPQPGDLPMVTATGIRPTVPISSGAPSLAAGIGGAGAQAVQAAERALAENAAREAPATTEGDEIVVTAKPDFPGGFPSVPLGAFGGLTAGQALQSGIAGTAADATPKKKPGVSDYLRLAGLASTALGALGGGGGGTAAGTVPGGLGGLNPIFSSQLPTANIPGGVGAASNLAPRQMGEEDWLTYGQRPERSFYNYAPQQPTGMAHGGSLEAKRGGSTPRTSFAVSGPGTGRSDDIPAVLSDGEYVIDAETVALLGDGSSKAGAQKLDDLRVKIRKHKGQKLSQGRFSANAKKPEAYLSGGRI